MSPLIQFPGYIPNSVAIQQLWRKTDLKGLGKLVHLKSDSFEILEREMDTMWLPWGTSKKKEKAWLKKALGLSSNLIQDNVLDLDSSTVQQKTSPESIFPEELHEKESQKELEKELEKEQIVPEVVVTAELHSQLEEFLKSTDTPATWDPASTYVSDEVTQHVPDFLVSLLDQDWFQKYFPNFNLEEVIVPEGLREMEHEKEREKEREKAQWMYKEVILSEGLHEKEHEKEREKEHEKAQWMYKEVILSEGLRGKEREKEREKEHEKAQWMYKEVILSESLRGKKHEKEHEKAQWMYKEVVSERLRGKEREEEHEMEREEDRLMPEEVILLERLREKEREEEREKKREKAQLVYKDYPECYTVEGLATLLLKVLEKASWEDGTQVMMVLVEMIPRLGIDFRKKLQNLLLKLLNKEPPPNLVDKIEKKFVMTALQMLMVVSLGSRDVVLELMSYFLYSPPRCRPALKKLLEDLGLRDPHNFLFKEMVTWAEGKDLTNKAALRGRCGQKLEFLIDNLKNHLKQNFLVPKTWEEDIKQYISTSPKEQQSRETSPVLPTTMTELPQFKFPQPPTPTPSTKDRTVLQFRSQLPPKLSPKHSPKLSPKHSPKISPMHSPKISPRHSLKLSPRHSLKLSPQQSLKLSPKHSPKLSPKHSPELSPMHSPEHSPTLSPQQSLKLSPDLPTTVPPSPSFLRLGFSPEIPTPPESRAISPPSYKFISFSQPSLLRRTVSEPHWHQTFEKNLHSCYSAPASITAGWLSFLDYEYPTVESPISKAPIVEIEIEVTPIDALNFFCEQQLQAQMERDRMRAAMRHAQPNTIVMQPRGAVLPTYHYTQGRKILRLQERDGSLTALDAPGVANFQRTRYRMSTISRSLKLPLPRVEPIPFPPAWPPPSRPLPPLILEDSLQRYFLPKLARPENYR